MTKFAVCGNPNRYYRWNDKNIELLCKVIAKNIDSRFTFQYFEITDKQFMKILEASKELSELSICHNKVVPQKSKLLNKIHHLLSRK